MNSKICHLFVTKQQSKMEPKSNLLRAEMLMWFQPQTALSEQLNYIREGLFFHQDIQMLSARVG